MRASIVALCLITTFGSSALAQRGEKPLSDSKKKQLAESLMEAGSYYNANDLFQEIYDKKQTPALAWNIADAYYQSRDYPNALTWYKKVWDVSPGAYPDAQFKYALCLKLNGQYDEAKKEFDSFRKSTKMKGAEATAMKRMAKNESKGCELAKLIIAEPLEMEINAMGARINAPYTEFAPFPLNEDEFIYASLRSDSIITMGANRKTTLRSQFYTSKRSGGVWAEGKLYDDMFNAMNGHVGNGSFSPDGNRFYFTVCNPAENVSKMLCEIYYSEFDDGRSSWGKPKKVPEVNSTNVTTTHPTLAIQKGKEILYFTTDRPGGRGGMDIWYSLISGKGKTYARPRNAGPKLNTSGDEITPYWNPSDELLYFSSNGHINIGGQDIFKVSGSQRSWKTPLNVGYPVNSNVDDFYYVTTADGERGFVVSNRKGAIALKSEFCCDDIFAFEYIYPPEFTIMGQIYEKGAATKTPIDAAFVVLATSSQPRMDSTVSSPAGPYDFYVGVLQDNFELSATKAGYTGAKGTVSTKGLADSDTLYVDLYLEPIDTTRSITIKDIYYELDRAELRPESRTGLDSLYGILMAYPTIQVELSSHTDSRGSYEYNVDLSQRRAESVVRYLVDQKGIGAERLVPRGYGETQLLNECADGVNCSEEQHQINRRTEFRILGQMPGTIVNYDKATIDAMRALERERGSLDSRIKDLMEQGEFEEIDKEVGSGEIDRDTGQELEAPVEIDPNTLTEPATEFVETVTETVTPTVVAGKVDLDNSLTKKGNLFVGQAMINGAAQTEYMIDARPPVCMISKDLFMRLNAAGTITDYKNSKPTTLPDGSTVAGDIFYIRTLQLGENILEDIETKLNMSMTRQDFVVSRKMLDANKCKIDLKKLKLTCK